MVSILFTKPIYLLILFLIPVLVFLHIATLRFAKGRALRFANFEAIGRIKGIDFFSKNIVILVLSSLIVFLIAMNLSGLTLNTTLNASSHSFVLAIDTSKSMEADDLSPSRMAAAKKSAINLVDTAPFVTNFGVVSFSGNALIEQEITNSKSLVKGAIENIEISEIGGTDILEAVITSTNLLVAEDSKAIILLSDGQLNVGSLEGAILYANSNGVIVNTIALGTEEGGKTSYGISKVDEDSLKALAFNTDGNFFRAVDEVGLIESFRESIDITKRKVKVGLGDYSLILAVLLFMIQYFLVNTRYKNIP
jgi:Ca-activated chloride channel homolog